MDNLNFYHQKRSDGGLRSGIDLNGERVLETYETGTQPEDPVLLWFVDVRCAGENLPQEPEAIRRWFLNRGSKIQPALKQLADDLPAGIDSGWPIRRIIPAEDQVSMAVYCSAIRRLSGREIAQVLSKLSENWSELVKQLDSYEHSILAHG